MTKPYSMDLRDRVVAAVEAEGMTRHQAAARFGIAVSSARVCTREDAAIAMQAIVWMQRYFGRNARPFWPLPFEGRLGRSVTGFRRSAFPEACSRLSRWPRWAMPALRRRQLLPMPHRRPLMARCLVVFQCHECTPVCDTV